jgi:hypothetical protein
MHGDHVTEPGSKRAAAVGVNLDWRVFLTLRPAGGGQQDKDGQDQM